MTAVKHDGDKPPARYFYYSGLVPFLLPEQRLMAARYEGLIKELVKDDRQQAMKMLAVFIDGVVNSLSNSFQIERSDVITKVSLVSKLGADKYGIFNYQSGFDWSRIVDAGGRHLLSYLTGDFIDKESTYDHRYHLLANSFMLAYHIQNDAGTNDLIEEKIDEQKDVSNSED